MRLKFQSVDILTSVSVQNDLHPVSESFLAQTLIVIYLCDFGYAPSLSEHSRCRCFFCSRLPVVACYLFGLVIIFNNRRRVEVANIYDAHMLWPNYSLILNFCKASFGLSLITSNMEFSQQPSIIQTRNNTLFIWWIGFCNGKLTSWNEFVQKLIQFLYCETNQDITVGNIISLLNA